MYDYHVGHRQKLSLPKITRIQLFSDNEIPIKFIFTSLTVTRIVYNLGKTNGNLLISLVHRLTQISQ